MGRKLGLAAVVTVFGAVACDGNNEAGGSTASSTGGNAPPAPTVRAAQAEPLTAVFTPATFTTKYNAKFANPDLDELSFDWSGTNCSSITITGPKTCSTASCTSEMAWFHPHPPCAADTSHSDATIFFTITGKRSGKTALCAYKGAETGTGRPCGLSGFDDSTVGPDTNFARVVYRQANNRCSETKLIQVVSYKSKGPPEAIVIPHNDAMLDDRGNPFYVQPAVEDDAGGFVVDKHVNNLGTNDPYYPESTTGSPTEPVELSDRPGNTKAGHKGYFEVCAFCSAKPTDPDFGKYLDCFSWEHDGDSGNARRSDPQPSQKPTPEFTAAVNKFVTNHGFKMPGAK